MITSDNIAYRKDLNVMKVITTQTLKKFYLLQCPKDSENKMDTE